MGICCLGKVLIPIFPSVIYQCEDFISFFPCHVSLKIKFPSLSVAGQSDRECKMPFQYRFLIGCDLCLPISDDDLIPFSSSWQCK